MTFVGEIVEEIIVYFYAVLIAVSGSVIHKRNFVISNTITGASRRRIIVNKSSNTR